MTENDLRDAGLSLTQVRALLLDALRSTHTPLSAEELGTRLSERGFHAGRASLYRNLLAFVEVGLAERIETDERGSRYIACSRNHHEHHHHIVCQECRRTEPVDICLSSTALRNIENSTNYQITNHSLTLFGLCSQCQKKDLN